jgi:hypothetical protein
LSLSAELMHSIYIKGFKKVPPVDGRPMLNDNKSTFSVNLWKKHQFPTNVRALEVTHLTPQHILLSRQATSREVFTSLQKNNKFLILTDYHKNRK